MIATIVRIGFRNLRRDRVVQMLVFVVPIVFFTIFSMVFGNQRNGTPRVTVAVVDEDHSDFSRRIVEALTREKALRIRTTVSPDGGEALDRAAAEKLVRDGDLPVAIVLPAGFGRGASFFGGGTGAPHVQLLADVSDQIAPQMTYGLLQKTVMTAAPDVLARSGIAQFDKYAGGLTPEQRTAVDRWMSDLHRDAASTSNPPQGDRAAELGLPIDTVDVMRQAPGSSNNIVSFYAAGLGVMFLLFSASGSSGSLIDEVDSGTLDRVLSTRLGMSGLLAGKFIYVTLLGMLQVTVMFVWGMVAFKLDLLAHLPGFVLMTVFSSMAAAGLGLVLATVARTRAQLAAIANIVVLTMSALGGSMFPRFLMSDTMQKVGLVTFNAWALDGYLKVFWRNAPLTALWPQLLVLAVLTLVFLAIARTVARRWETA
jgi:ABC-2 type transport system permease protein